MIQKLLILIFLPAAISFASWPDTILELKQSMCLVEFYQPQYEIREIKDDSRIKKKLSGVLVNKNGLIMTSDIIFPASLDIVSGNRFYTHMQSPPEDISVAFDGDREYKADLLGIDEEFRVAFIQIREPEDLPEAIKFSAKTDYGIGDEIFLLQQLDERYNLEFMITNHHINAIVGKPFKKWLTTSMVPSISTGGLAINSDGEPIGIIYRGDQDMESNHFAMDIDMVGSFITQILPSGHLTKLIKNPPKMNLQKNGTGKSWIGIRMQILKKEMAVYWGIPEVSGIIINSIVPMSPAEKAGLQIGDIVTGINGFSLQGDEDQDLELFRSYIRSLPEGPVRISYFRDKKHLTAQIEMEHAPMSKFFAEEYSEEFLRFSVKELTQDIILENDLDFGIEGVWVSRVEEASAAGLSGLMVNDLILSIDDYPVKDLAVFREIIDKQKLTHPLYIKIFVKRNNKTIFIFVKTTFDMNRPAEG